MKKILFLLFFSTAVLVGSSMASFAGEPCLEFKDTEQDFGKVKESRKKVTREFSFKNTGDKPLILAKSIVSCKCVDVTFSKKPVNPGEENKITVTYNPKKQKGIFHKAIQIYSNDPKKRHIITIKGEVIP